MRGHDPEHWRATPRAEQHDPLRYMALFARAADNAGYQAILMPGRDLLLTSGGQWRSGGHPGTAG
jgi:hypothetical protein